MVVKRKFNPLVWSKYHKFLTFLLLLTLAVIGIFIFRSYEKHQNKLAFQEARVAIDSIYGEVITKVGQPDNYQSTNSCSRPNQIWAQGPLSCFVSIDFIYGVKDLSEATKKYKSIQQYVNKEKILKQRGQLSSAITDELIVDTYYHSAYDAYTSTRGLRCSANYIFDTEREITLSINNPNLKNFQINLVCSGGAKEAYYPLDN